LLQERMIATDLNRHLGHGQAEPRKSVLDQFPYHVQVVTMLALQLFRH
jgi:hypothetical protein